MTTCRPSAPLPLASQALCVSDLCHSVSRKQHAKASPVRHANLGTWHPEIVCESSAECPARPASAVGTPKSLCVGSGADTARAARALCARGWRELARAGSLRSARVVRLVRRAARGGAVSHFDGNALTRASHGYSEAKNTRVAR